jgi:hypothetical protein
LTALTGLGWLWAPLVFTLPLLGLAIGALVVPACLNAARVALPGRQGRWERAKLRMLTAALHLLQPMSRLLGRLGYGLAPWRWRGSTRFAVPRPKTQRIWSEQWRSPAEWLEALEAAMLETGAVVRRGGDYDRWDLHVRSGTLSATRVRLATEEHGSGRQLLRFGAWPRPSWIGVVTVLLLAGLSGGAALQGALTACFALAGAAAALVITGLLEAATAMASLDEGLDAIAGLADASAGGMALPRTELRPPEADEYVVAPTN